MESYGQVLYFFINGYLIYFIFLECQDLMRNGTKVLKISFLENGKKNVSKKTLLLDEDKASIRYQPTKKGITFKSKSFEEQKQPFSDVPQKCAYSTPTLLRNRRRHRYSRANFEKLYTIAFSWNTFQWLVLQREHIILTF